VEKYKTRAGKKELSRKDAKVTQKRKEEWDLSFLCVFA
jgi:hypothetical protein